eukprot:10550172-Heterocapsa_arctica.AAC.1
MHILLVFIDPLAANGRRLTFPVSLVKIAMANGLIFIKSGDQECGNCVKDMTILVPSGIFQPIIGKLFCCVEMQIRH